MLTKKEITKLIRKSASEQIKTYREHIKELTDEEMEFKYQGGIEGVKEFLINLKEIKIIN